MLWDMAMRHCLTTRRVLVRGDGSTAHEGIFDLRPASFSARPPIRATGAIRAGRAGLPGRCTASAPVYDYTRDPRFLETAESCADYYITHTPADGVPPWDFDAPADSRKLLDTSAAAIAASGLLRTLHG